MGGRLDEGGYSRHWDVRVTRGRGPGCGRAHGGAAKASLGPHIRAASPLLQVWAKVVLSVGDTESPGPGGGRRAHHITRSSWSPN